MLQTRTRSEVVVYNYAFDGYGQHGHQDAAGRKILNALAHTAERNGWRVDVEHIGSQVSDPHRTGSAQLANWAALEPLLKELKTTLTSTVQRGTFPLVLGGDCSSLLASIPATTQVFHRVQLVMFDAHEDSMPLDVVEDGEAANCEIGILLGLTGNLAREPALASARGAVSATDVAILGHRDANLRAQFNVGSLADSRVYSQPWQHIAPTITEAMQSAATQLRLGTQPWWLHVDLDVLDRELFPAQGFPDVQDPPGGMSPSELRHGIETLLQHQGCVGASIANYDPAQDDPAQSCAQTVITQLIQPIWQHATSPAPASQT